MDPWKLNNTLPNNNQFKEEIKKEVMKFIECKENEERGGGGGPKLVEHNEGSSTRKVYSPRCLDLRKIRIAN